MSILNKKLSIRHFGNKKKSIAYAVKNWHVHQQSHTKCQHQLNKSDEKCQ